MADSSNVAEMREETNTNVRKYIGNGRRYSRNGKENKITNSFNIMV